MASNLPFPTKLLWVDLEMTGLDAEQDVILEVAAEVTDFAFAKLASYEARVRQDPKVTKDRMAANSWWADYPANRDDFLSQLGNGKPSDVVEQELLQLIADNFAGQPAILAGNSIHNDRNFIRQWWPTLDAALHYRMFDVTTLKIFMQGRHGTEYQKQDAHRAYGDIQESIAEWQYYLQQLSSEDEQ